MFLFTFVPYMMTCAKLVGPRNKRQVSERKPNTLCEMLYQSRVLRLKINDQDDKTPR